MISFVVKFFDTLWRKTGLEGEKKVVFFSACWLYGSASIGFTLAAKTLTYWMLSEGLSYSFIALIGAMLHLPYSIRLIYVPWLEFTSLLEIKALGHRKSWLLWSTLVSATCLIVGAVVGFNNFWLMFALFLVCSVSTTCFETLTSAYFLQVYEAEMKPTWMQAGQIGYNAALYLCSTAFLALSVFVQWKVLYIISALALFINIPILFYIRPCTFVRMTQPDLNKVYWEPLREFYVRNKEYIKPLAIFSLFYRAPDKMLGPILPLLMVDFVGKLAAAALKTMSLLAMFMGSFWWKKFYKTGHIDALMTISKIHLANVLLFGSFCLMYLYTPYKLESLLLIAVSSSFLRFARTMESSAMFNFQCSMYENKYFSAQAAMGTFVDKAFGDIVSATSGFVKDQMGIAVFFVFSASLVLPAWVSARKLNGVKLKYTNSAGIKKE